MEPIRWQIHEYEHAPKTPDWFWSVAVLALAFVVVSFLLDNILFAAIIAIGSFAVLLFALRKPNEVICEIREEGILFDTVLYPFESTHSFWVETKITSPKIILASKKLLSPYITIPIHEEDADAIRSALGVFLPEREHRESAFVILFRHLGF